MAQHTERQKTTYSAPDHTVRCQRCSMGTDNLGRNIGYPIVSRQVSCEIEKGRSILIGKVGRCSKGDNEYREGVRIPDCNTLYNLVLTKEADKLGITKKNVLKCLFHSKGDLFTIKELLQGGIDFIEPPPGKGAVDDLIPLPNIKTSNYNPNAYTEVEELSF